MTTTAEPRTVPPPPPTGPPTRPGWRVVNPYALAVLAALAALALRLLVYPYLGPRAPYTFSTAAVVFVACYAGFRPALLTAVLCGLLLRVWVMATPEGWFSGTDDLLGFGLYLLVAVACGRMADSVRSARAQAERQAAELLAGREELRAEVAARARAEEELRALAAGLERRVAERTADLERHAAELALANDRLREAHNRLGQTSSRLRGILEGTPDFIATVDNEYCFLDVNRPYRKEFERIFGVKAEVGSSNLEALAHLPAQRARAAEAWGRALAGERFTITQEYGDKRRHWGYYELSYSPLRDESGRVTGAAQIVRDVTPQRRAEAALRESEERFRSFINNGPAVAWMKDEAGHYVYLNELYQREFGARLEKWRGKTDAELWPAEVARELRANDLQVLASDAPMDAIETAPGADGGLRQWWSFKFPFRDAGGARYVGGMAIDVTEREAAREALHRQTELLRSILEGMSEAVVVADQNLKLVLFNPAAERMFGVGVTDAPVAEWPSRYNLFQRDGVTPFAGEQLPLARALRGECVSDADIVVRHEGTREGIWTVATARPLRGPDGRAIGAVVVHHDVTELHRSRQALAERAAELERSNAELERSNAELEQFAYVASHDLQEPLRMVGSYVGLLAERYQGRLDERADKYIHYATDGAARMQVLIQDLLAFSRVTTRAREPEPTDAGAALDRALANLQAALGDGGAVVTRDPLPVVRADPTQLAQVFQNLVGNALKFCDEPTPRVHVSAVRRGGAWEFAVRDNGIGIAPAHRERIFQLFQRLHQRGRYPGTGIGLAICKKVVERHGGHIRVESEAGRGSTFLFTLPAGDEV